MSSNSRKTSTKYQNIPLKPETYTKLRELGHIGDSFDSVVRKLLKQNDTDDEDD